MKSFFTNLGKALLCGAVVAMIGCTDLHSDIKLVETTNNEALKELAAKLEADYATKQALAAAQEALNAKDGDLQAAIDDVKKSLEGYATNDAVNAVLAHVAELEAALGAAQEEVNAALAGLQAALETAQEEIYGRIETVEETLSASLVLIEDLAAEDEQIWNSFNTLQESVSALSTLLDEATAEHDQIYQQIQTVTETLSTVITMLEDYATKQEVEEVYTKINTVEEFITGLTNRVVDVEDALAIHLAAFEAYKLSVEEAIALATEDMQEYLTQMLNVTNDQIAEITALQEALVQRIDTLEKFCTNIINNYQTADEELLALIVETKEELTLVVNNILNYLSDMQGQIDDLAARVQSLVFIPEYSDGKATIEWGLLIDNDSAVNFILKNIATRQNLVLFKDLVVDFLKEVKDIAVELGGPVVDYADKTIDQFISDLVNTEAMADALKIMLSGIEDIVAKEVAELYNEKFAGLGEEIAIPEGVPTVDELTKSIMSELYQSIDLSKLDIKKILKTVITKVTNKAFDLVSVDAIITELKKINIYDAIDMLTSAEFEGLLSDLLQVVKSFEEKALSNTALLKKESVIRYKVQAQNAAAVAKAIAANPSVLSYDVEAVDVRAAAPALEITKVVAKGDEIHVSVVPQNFHYRFYLTYVLEDSFIYGAAESFFDKYGKTGLISYSAALVLNDGNNIRSTEYVNFVSSENPEIFTPEVVRNGEVVEYETIQAVKGETETIELCKDMQMAYLSVPHRKILTKEGLAQKGFFGITEKVTVVTANGEAGPCEFNGRVGEMFDWFDYTFTTVWSVNDIELVVKSNLICK
ncbi:MAG: hypothetical protein IIX08_10720 [Bacteroidales bacterium]|nr:hypothetical protein [Bacteroidales bacterium]